MIEYVVSSYSPYNGSQIPLRTTDREEALSTLEKLVLESMENPNIATSYLLSIQQDEVMNVR